MCQYKSGIVLKDETRKAGFRLLMSPWTDSHSDLIALHNLNDGAHLHFARVEFSPPTKEDISDPDKYVLRLDEERTPDWYTSEIAHEVELVMRRYVRSIIVTDTRELLIGGEFIISGSAKVNRVTFARVHAICDSAQVKRICDSARVESISGSAQVKYIYDSAQVKYICDSAQVKRIYGSAQVESIYGSAQVTRTSPAARKS